MKREFSIYRTLRALARQRVVGILQPTGYFIVERAPEMSEGTEENLRTCELRGWIEPLAHGVPRAPLPPHGRLPPGPLFTEKATVYRLTDSGWNAIHRAHITALLSIIVSVLAVIASKV